MLGSHAESRQRAVWAAASSPLQDDEEGKEPEGVKYFWVWLKKKLRFCQDAKPKSTLKKQQCKDEKDQDEEDDDEDDEMEEPEEEPEEEDDQEEADDDEEDDDDGDDDKEEEDQEEEEAEEKPKGFKRKRAAAKKAASKPKAKGKAKAKAKAKGKGRPKAGKLNLFYHRRVNFLEYNKFYISATNTSHSIYQCLIHHQSPFIKLLLYHPLSWQAGSKEAKGVLDKLNELMD